MPVIMEKETTQVVINALESQTLTTGNVDGAIIDASQYDDGIYFALLVSGWTNGTFTLTLYDDTDAAFGGTPALIAAPRLTRTTNPVFALATVEGENLSKQGVFSTRRYIRAKVTCVAGAAGATVTVIATANPDSTSMPTAQA